MADEEEEMQEKRRERRGSKEGGEKKNGKWKKGSAYFEKSSTLNGIKNLLPPNLETPTIHKY